MTTTQHNRTELEARIIEILTEDTGINGLDSGGVNGRGWQRNRLIDDWNALPTVDVDTCGDDIMISYSTFHYLNNFLDITDESERLNNVMKGVMEESGASYYDDMEEFLSFADVGPDPDGYTGIVNTYNYDNIIDHVLQYAIFEVDGESYIILQVHLGADVRGGYSVPQVFALPEPDYFITTQNDVTARCGCSDWYSDDGGQHYYRDGSPSSPDPDWSMDEDTNAVTCNKCGGPVEFGVMESF